MLTLVLGFTDAGANEVPQVLYSGNNVREAREALREGAKGIVRAHLVVNPMVHQIKRYGAPRPKLKKGETLPEIGAVASQIATEEAAAEKVEAPPAAEEKEPEKKPLAVPSKAKK